MAVPDSRLDFSHWPDNEAEVRAAEPRPVDDNVDRPVGDRNDNIINDRNNAIDNKINTDNGNANPPLLRFTADGANQVSGPAQPENLPGTNTIHRTTDANVPRQPPQNASTNYDQDADMRSVPQQGDVQVVAHSVLAPDSLSQIQASNVFDQIIQSPISSFAHESALEIIKTSSPFNQMMTQLPTSSFAHGSDLEIIKTPNPYNQTIQSPMPSFAPESAFEITQIHLPIDTLLNLDKNTTNALDETNQSWPSSSFSQAPVPQSMQAYQPNGPSPSVFNQISITEQQPTSSQYDIHLRLEERGINLNLNDSPMLPSYLACDLYGIHPSEQFMDVDGYETDPLCNQSEQHRCPNARGYEVPNTHDSINYAQDVETQNAPQQEHVQVHNALASGSLPRTQASNVFGQPTQQSTSSFAQMQAPEPMQAYLPNGLSPSIFNQNLTTEQQPTSSRYGQPPTTGGPPLIKEKTDEEIDGLRKLKPKEDRRKRTENPDPEHKKEVRKASSKEYYERNLEEKTGLNSMKQRLEESIKIKKSSRVERINLYNEMQEKAVPKMALIVNALKKLRCNIPPTFDSTLEECTNRSIDRINYFINNNTRLFIHNYLLSDEWDINNQNNLESEEDLLNDLKNIEEGLKQLKMDKKKIEKQMEEQKLCPTMRRIIEEIIDQMAKDLKKKKGKKWNMNITHAEYIHFVRKSQSLQKSLIRANINMMESEFKLLSQEKQYKLNGDTLSSRKHRKNKALERIRLRNENKRLKSKDDKIGKDLIEIESRRKSLLVDIDDVLREGIDCIDRWIQQYQITNRPLSQHADIEFSRYEIHEFLQKISIYCKS